MQKEESSVSVADSVLFDASKTVCFLLYFSLIRNCGPESSSGLAPHDSERAWTMSYKLRSDGTVKNIEIWRAFKHATIMPVVLWHIIKRNTDKINQVKNEK